MKPWTTTEEATLRRLAATLTAQQIAERLNRTRESVRCRASRIGVALAKVGDCRHGTKHSDALVEHIRCLYDEGRGPAAIAAATGVPRNTVRSIVYFRHRLTAAPRATQGAAHV